MDRYLFAIFPEKTIADCEVDNLSTNWHRLEEADDDRIENLMRWVYNYHVLNLDDSRVCCYEQKVFEVKKLSGQTRRQPNGRLGLKCLTFGTQPIWLCSSAWLSDLL